MTTGNMPLLLGFGLLAGIIIPIQTALNAQLSRTAGHPLLTTLCVFGIGGMACVLALAISRPALPELAEWRSLPLWAWGGGIISMIYVVLVVFIAPRLGVGLTTTLVLAGQLLAAMLLDHFGALGNPIHPMNPMRAVGLGLMIAGVLLIKKF